MEKSINAVAFRKLITIMAEKKCEIYSAKTHQFFPGNFCLIFGQSSSVKLMVTKKKCLFEVVCKKMSKNLIEFSRI